MNEEIGKSNRQKIFDQIQKSLCTGIRNGNSLLPQNWMKERGLSFSAHGIGFNSGQMHHKKSKEYQARLESVGFIKATNIISIRGTGYLVFGKYGITIPLRDEKGNVVNFYAIRLKTKVEEHSLLNEEGIFPAFPDEMTTKLFITTSMIDAITLMESKVLKNRDSLMCIPNGEILEQHEKAIRSLSSLKSIVWIETGKVEILKSLKGKMATAKQLEKTKMEAA